jgi:hypothetical protein
LQGYFNLRAGHAGSKFLSDFPAERLFEPVSPASAFEQEILIVDSHTHGIHH